MRIQLILDAGDGAMYAGSRSENQVYEKHMNLIYEQK